MGPGSFLSAGGGGGSAETYPSGVADIRGVGMSEDTKISGDNVQHQRWGWPELEAHRRGPKTVESVSIDLSRPEYQLVVLARDDPRPLLHHLHHHRNVAGAPGGGGTENILTTTIKPNNNNNCCRGAGSPKAQQQQQLSLYISFPNVTSLARPGSKQAQGPLPGAGGGGGKAGRLRPCAFQEGGKPSQTSHFQGAAAREGPPTWGEGV